MERDYGVGREVKRLREARKWSQARLAVEADMSVSGVSMIENGHRNLSTTTLAKLAKALGIEVADLFPKGQVPLPDLVIGESISPREAQRRPKTVTGEAHLSGTGKLTAAGEVVEKIRQIMDKRREEKISDEEVVKQVGQLFPRERIPA